jgi:hypothetical protein
LRQSPPIPQARTVVVADSDPSIKAGGSDSEDEEGAALDQRRVDQRTSDLVDRETGRKGKEQVMVRQTTPCSSLSSPAERSRVVFPAAAP